MAEETLFSVRWSSSFLLTEAEQPVANLRTLLTPLRYNQWVLLARDWIHERSFYPFRKRELQFWLLDAEPRSAVSEVLRLTESGSEPVTERASDLRLRIPEQGKEYLNRRVLLDSRGNPVAIAEAKVPIERASNDAFQSKSERGTSAAAIPVEVISTEEPEDGEYRVVRIYYGTDRQEVTSKKGDTTYSRKRATDERLRYGTCDISIPTDRRMGTLESPKWWHVLTRRKPAQFVMLLSTLPRSKEDFFVQLQSATAQSDSTSLFVFIPGFNVDFEDAARRTAQLAYDLGFHGAPVLYSWPSEGKVRGYMADEATVDWTKPHLKSFIQDLVAHSGASAVHIIAHSMGNRALVRVLNELGTLSGSERLIHQVVLTAPDIDKGEFEQLANAMSLTAERVTLYASSKDKVLELSKKFHVYPRAGDANPSIVVIGGVDTIDSSSVDTSLLGHSYYCERRTILSDLFYIVSEGAPPEKRHGLEPRHCALGQYWAFRP